MGGQNTAACANATTPAPIPTTNICPAGWRLPTGGSSGEFKILNNSINNGITTSDVGLISSPWLGQRGGYWSGSFVEQESAGYYFSSTLDSNIYAYGLSYSDKAIKVEDNDNGRKDYGRPIRCVTQ